jgi:TonB-dependent SusC/RagA subfamily outer membrane receptor
VNGYYIVLDPLSFPAFNTPPEMKKRFYSTQQTVGQFRNYYMDTTVVNNKKSYLKTVTVRAYRRKEVNYDESKRISQFSRIVTSEQLGNSGFGNMANALLMVPGVHIMGGYLVVGGPRGFGFSGRSEPLIVMDGIEYGDSILSNYMNYGESSPVLSFLNKISSANIDFIEVLSGPEAAAFGTRGANGVIIVNTKTWKENSHIANGLKNFIVRGYHIPNPFPLPEYSNPQIRKSKAPDHRSSLFWKGDILIQKGSSFSCSFYTSDVPATYQISITGITEQGQPVSKQLFFSVH